MVPRGLAACSAVTINSGLSSDCVYDARFVIDLHILQTSDKPGIQVFTGLKVHLLSTCTVRVSYLEIYNEQCYDLLDISAQPSDIAIIEDSKDRVIVKGLAAPVVDNEAEALQHLFEVRH